MEISRLQESRRYCQTERRGRRRGRDATGVCWYPIPCGAIGGFLVATKAGVGEACVAMCVVWGRRWRSGVVKGRHGSQKLERPQRYKAQTLDGDTTRHDRLG